MIKTRTTAAVLAVATAVTLAGCSSSGSGGSGVSTSQLEAKLKNSPQIAALKQDAAGSKIDANKLVDCVAKTLQKDASASTLKDFVDGKITVNGIKPKSSASKSDAKSDFITCAKSAVKS